MENIDFWDLQEEQEDTVQGQFLTFLLEQETFGLPIADIDEIIGLQPITPLPEMSAAMRGVINLRGQIIPVLDARAYLQKPAIAYTDRSCVIILRQEEAFLGLIVDGVQEVLQLPDDCITDNPQHQDDPEACIGRIGRLEERVILLLDPRQFFKRHSSIFESTECLGVHDA
jgi:purine-binding chemotaxis protein CheW